MTAIELGLASLGAATLGNVLLGAFQAGKIVAEVKELKAIVTNGLSSKMETVLKTMTAIGVKAEEAAEGADLIRDKAADLATRVASIEATCRERGRIEQAKLARQANKGA